MISLVKIEKKTFHYCNYAPFPFCYSPRVCIETCLQGFKWELVIMALFAISNSPLSRTFGLVSWKFEIIIIIYLFIVDQ